MTEDVVITQKGLKLRRELILNCQDEELYEFNRVVGLLPLFLFRILSVKLLTVKSFDLLSPKLSALIDSHRFKVVVGVLFLIVSLTSLEFGEEHDGAHGNWLEMVLTS